MSQVRIKQILMSAAVLCTVSLNAQQARHYPDAALTHIFTQEQIEQKKADELEQKLVYQRDLIEKQKREVEKQVAAHRYSIEGIKMKQERAQAELETISVDLQHVNGDLASYQAEHQQLTESSQATLSYLNNQRDELATKQKNLDAELVSLAETRKKAEKEVFELGMEIERYKVSSAKAETKVQEAEAVRAAMEADEMKVRSEWMSTKLAAAEQMRQRDEALQALSESRVRYEQAQKELRQAKVDLAKAQTVRDDVAKKSQSQIAQYENDIMKSTKGRIYAEAEKIRLESEVAKIQDYSARIKDARDQALDQQGHVNGLVLKSSLALESARTALATSVERSDQYQYKNEKAQHRARGLAAAEEASNLIEGGRVWITSENCKAYKTPATRQPAGFFDSGKRLLGKDHGSAWVEVMNGSGSSVYVESRCGKYEN